MTERLEIVASEMKRLCVPSVHEIQTPFHGAVSAFEEEWGMNQCVTSVIPIVPS